MSSSKSTPPSNAKPTTYTTPTRKSGPYDRNFQQNLIDGGIYPHGYEYPDDSTPARPNNWEEINERLGKSRPSLSLSQFSDSKFRDFGKADACATKENQVITTVIPFIQGEILNRRCVSGNIPLTNLDPLTDGTLVPGNPDLYVGARPEQLNRQVRNDLSKQIIPSTQDDLPMVPNFFLAVKGPDGAPAVTGRQACYDGALGARGIHSLQTYRQDEPAYENNAYTVTSIYHDSQLKMYTSHPAQPRGPGSRPEYHMTQINAWAMAGNAKTFRQGATAFRNLRDWTKEQRDAAIRYANDRANSLPTTTPTVPGVTPESRSHESLPTKG